MPRFSLVPIWSLRMVDAAKTLVDGPTTKSMAVPCSTGSGNLPCTVTFFVMDLPCQDGTRVEKMWLILIKMDEIDMDDSQRKGKIGWNIRR